MKKKLLFNLKIYSKMKESFEFRTELVELLVNSLVTNLELCANVHKDSKDYCELLMDKLESAYKSENIDELDKLFGMCNKVLTMRNII